MFEFSLFSYILLAIKKENTFEIEGYANSYFRQS